MVDKIFLDVISARCSYSKERSHVLTTFSDFHEGQNKAKRRHSHSLFLALGIPRSGNIAYCSVLEL